MHEIQITLHLDINGKIIYSKKECMNMGCSCKGIEETGDSEKSYKSATYNYDLIEKISDFSKISAVEYKNAKRNKYAKLAQ